MNRNEKKLAFIIKAIIILALVVLSVIVSNKISSTLCIILLIIYGVIAVFVLRIIFKMTGQNKKINKGMIKAINELWEDRDADKCLAKINSLNCRYETTTYKANLALVYYCAGDYDKVNQLLDEEERLTKLTNKDPKIAVGLEWTIWSMRAHMYADSENYEEAVKIFDTYTEKFNEILCTSKLATYWIQLYKSMAKEEYQKAFETLDQIYNTLYSYKKSQCGILWVDRADIYNLRVLKKLNRYNEAQVILDDLKERKIFTYEEKLLEEMQ